VLLGDGGQRAGSVVHVVEGNGIVAVYLGHEKVRNSSSVPRAPTTATASPMPVVVVATCSQVGTRGRWSSCGCAGPRAAVARCGGMRRKGARLV
jgi:hypothetical protein